MQSTRTKAIAIDTPREPLASPPEPAGTEGNRVLPGGTAGSLARLAGHTETSAAASGRPSALPTRIQRAVPVSAYSEALQAPGAFAASRPTYDAPSVEAEVGHAPVLVKDNRRAGNWRTCCVPQSSLYRMGRSGLGGHRRGRARCGQDDCQQNG